jgi:hypothetical protein
VEGAGDGNRSATEALDELSSRLSDLVRQEIALGRAEIAENLRQSARASAMLGAAAGCGVLAVAAAHGGVMGALTRRLSPMAAAVVAGTCYGVSAVALARRGIDELRRHPPLLHRTAESLKEDLQWVAHPTTSAAT